MDHEADSGANLPESLAWFDPAGLCWKMSQCLFGEVLDESSPIWPVSGIVRNGKLYRLHPSEPRTSAGGSFLWPTPTVSGNHNRKGSSPQAGDGLATAVLKAQMLWPTPVASDAVRFETGITGRLNPRWVEWLMGFPIGWTDCGDSETHSFLRLPKPLADESLQSGSSNNASDL